jgi:hypothetical protein
MRARRGFGNADGPSCSFRLSIGDDNMAPALPGIVNRKRGQPMRAQQPVEAAKTSVAGEKSRLPRGLTIRGQYNAAKENS